MHELRKRQEEEQQALVCEAAPEEAQTAYERALQASQHKADAEHPPSAVGVDGLSVQAARRKARFRSKMLRLMWPRCRRLQPRAAMHST